MELDAKWKFNVLEIYDYRHSGPLAAYFDFLDGLDDSIPGDVCEIGVFRGRTLLAAAKMLRDKGSQRVVWGFDSFNGFPSYSDEDAPTEFLRLHADGKISDDHLSMVHQNWELLEVVGRSPSPSRSSSSGSFSGTSKEFVTARAHYLGLDNISLCVGPFETTMADGRAGADEQGLHRISAALMDCDLYGSHQIALSYVWERLSPGGMIFLDEYFSLKFPGARRAIDQFCDSQGVTPTPVGVEEGWERWVLFKPQQ